VTRDHLRRGAMAGAAGLAWALVWLAAQLHESREEGEPLEWDGAAPSVPAVAALFFLGGVLYSLLLRGRSLADRARAGAIAGLIAALPLDLLHLARPPDGVPRFTLPLATHGAGTLVGVLLGVASGLRGSSRD
jgi:hypothetical protein